MNKHLTDLSILAARVVAESSAPFKNSTEHEYVKVPVPLLQEIQKVLEDTPISEVGHAAWAVLAKALERKF